MDRHKEVQTELSALPPDYTDDPLGHLTVMLNSFCNQLTELVKGTPSMASLVQHNKGIYEDFKAGIESTTPVFHASISPPPQQGYATPRPSVEMCLDDVKELIRKLVDAFIALNDKN
jgi:hypothetical protein